MMASQTPLSARIRLGCQTNAWPVDAHNAETLSTALRHISELGFEGFETGFRNIPLLDRDRSEHGNLSVFGVHIFLHNYDAETRVAPALFALQVARNAAAVGAERLILSGAPASGEAAVAKAEALNTIAAEIEPLGLQLAYHNHGPEVAGAQPEIETLFAATDPLLVSFLLDAGHAFRAGLNVPEFVARHSGRLTALHLRDFKAGRQVPLGEGDFPLEELADVLKENGWRGWVLAEEEREDGSKPGLGAVSTARRVLERAFGV